MNTVKQVNDFIAENVLHSEVWDSATEQQKQKAVNQADRTLKRLFPKIYIIEVPVEHLSEQCLWILKVDDMFQRAEMGATYIAVDGIAMNIATKDRSICPFLMDVLNLSEGWNSRRKVGRYSTYLKDSSRKAW